MWKFIRRFYSKTTFDDGSFMQSTTKESMVFVDKTMRIDFEFYCNKNHCSIFLYKKLDESIFNNFKSKMTKYCLERGYEFEINNTEK